MIDLVRRKKGSKRKRNQIYLIQPDYLGSGVTYSGLGAIMDYLSTQYRRIRVKESSYDDVNTFSSLDFSIFS